MNVRTTGEGRTWEIRREGRRSVIAIPFRVSLLGVDLSGRVIPAAISFDPQGRVKGRRHESWFGAPPPANPARDTKPQNSGGVGIYGVWYHNAEGAEEAGDLTKKIILGVRPSVTASATVAPP